MSLLGDIADSIIKGAVTKAVNGFVTKGEITAAQAPLLVDGIMIEVQLAGEMYVASQKPASST